MVCFKSDLRILKNGRDHASRKFDIEKQGVSISASFGVFLLQFIRPRRRWPNTLRSRIPDSDGHNRQRLLKSLGTSVEGDIACLSFRTWEDGEGEDSPNFGTLSKAGRSFSTESRVFRFTLRGFQDNVSNRARSSPLVVWQWRARWERLSWWKEAKALKQQSGLTSNSKGQEYPT